MKKITKLLIVVVLSMFVLLCAGCARRQSGTEERVIRFGTFSQEERKEYIIDYLEEKYGIRYEIPEDVTQQVMAYFFASGYYYASAITSQEEVHVWVSGDGEITDNRFVIEYRDKIDALMADIIKKYYPRCEVRTITHTEGRPQETWGPDGDARLMLETEATRTSIAVFVNGQDLMTEESWEEVIPELSFCEGSVYVFVCEDIHSIDSSEINWPEYLYRVVFRKEQADE